MERDLLSRRLDDLMKIWSFPGAAAAPLLPLLEASACAWFPPERVLCRAGEPGTEMFILFSGSVEIQIPDRDGRPLTVATLQAPALLGHMSLLERNNRNATCTVKERAYIGVISQQVFTRFYDDRGPSGTVFRRLLLANLSRQLQAGDARLHQLLGRETAAPEEDVQQELNSTVRELEGWQSTPGPTDGDGWRDAVSRRAAALPLEPGATLAVIDNAETPLVLSMRGLPRTTSEQAVQRFIRFLRAIPTPPAIELRYDHCTSSLLQRPQQVSKQLSFHFARNEYHIEGDEERIVVTFTAADPCWSAA